MSHPTALTPPRSGTCPAPFPENSRPPKTSDLRRGASAFFRALLLCVALAGLLRPAAAQSDYTHLSIRVVYPDDLPVGLRVRVQLLLQTGVIVDEYIADERGVVSFSVQEGIYLIKASGLEIEDTLVGPFEIFDMQPSHEEYVHVRLKPGRSLASAGPAMVSTLDLKAPDGARKEYQKGRRAAEVGDWPKATKHFEKAVVLYPQYASAHNGLALALERQGQREAARQAFQKALDVDAKFARPYVHLARFCLEDKKPSEALALMEKATALEPANPESLTLMAQAQLASGKLDDALATARKVHSVPHEGFAQIHVIAGIALENRKLPHEARAEYEEFLKEAPRDPDAPTVRAALKKLPAPESRNRN
ncbi:MAG: tetratricopeptide repeat protein [Acidobacteria bacterium]|nr:tetratricopeptide repeat protein [Acidobacteriota bacterium]